MTDAPPHPRHRHQPGHRRSDRRRARAAIASSATRSARRRRPDRGRPFDAGAARPRSGGRRWRRSTGGSTCWSTMPACSRPAPIGVERCRLGGELGADAADQPARRRRALPARRAPFPRARAAAAGSSTSPAAPPIAATAPITGIMPRPRPAWSAMTKTIARAYAGEGIYAFTVCPGFTVTGMVEDYLESRGGLAVARRPADRPARRRPTRSPRRCAGWPWTRRPRRPAR